MVTENYPGNYIRRDIVNPIAPSQIVTESAPMTSDSTNDDRSRPLSQLERLDREIRRRQDTIERLESGKTKANNPAQAIANLKRDIKALREARNNLKEKGVAEYTVNTQESQDVRDITFDSAGNPVSKAFEVQTPVERQRTAEFSTTLISTKEGVIQDGRIPIGSDSGFNSGTVFDNRGNQETLSTSVPEKTVRPTSEVFGKVGLYSQIVQTKDFLKREQYDNPVRAGVYEASQFGLGVVSVPVQIVTRPKEFVLGVYDSLIHPRETLYGVGESLRTDSSFFIGQQVGSYGTFKLLGKGAQLGKQTYIKAGSTYVPSEEVFSRQVLIEGKKFPTTGSTSEALTTFNVPDSQGKIIVSTASPSKISGLEVSEGTRAKVGLEDPGIYVTPRGEGSPAFLGIGKASGYEFTLNPVKPIKEFFSTPGVTEFEVLGVVRQPREVVSQAGFRGTRLFFETEGSKSGFAFITKRSELGQGELVPQVYRLNEPAISQSSGRLITKFKEVGTTELEAVIPLGARFEYAQSNNLLSRFKGFESYTLYEGNVIPIRRARLLTENPSRISRSGESVPIIKTVDEAYKESSLLSGKKSFSPISSLKYSLSSGSDISSSSENNLSKYNINSGASSNLSSSNISDFSFNNLSSPSVPSSPSIPSAPSIPSVPSSPSIPSTPSIPSVPSRPNSSIVKTPELSFPRIPNENFNFNEPTKKKKSKFTLFVRKQGKFEIKGISEDSDLLFKKGFDINRMGASASLKVVDEGGRSILPKILPGDFAKSRRTEGVIIQKRERRISTSGEKFEITRKGIQASRYKRLI